MSKFEGNCRNLKGIVKVRETTGHVISFILCAGSGNNCGNAAVSLLSACGDLFVYGKKQYTTTGTNMQLKLSFFMDVCLQVHAFVQEVEIKA